MSNDYVALKVSFFLHCQSWVNQFGLSVLHSKERDNNHADLLLASGQPLTTTTTTTATVTTATTTTTAAAATTTTAAVTMTMTTTTTNLVENVFAA